LQLKYEELKTSMVALTKSLVYSLLEKIRHLASRPVLEFNRFWALDLLDPLTNPNNQFHNFLLPLLGDKDQEKVLEVVAKVEKNNHKKPVRQSSRPGRKAMPASYMGVRCCYCNPPGHIFR
ncbi:unnamed protein product, partial [Porites evermanni]